MSYISSRFYILVYRHTCSTLTKILIVDLYEFEIECYLRHQGCSHWYFPVVGFVFVLGLEFSDIGAS